MAFCRRGARRRSLLRQPCTSARRSSRRTAPPSSISSPTICASCRRWYLDPANRKQKLQLVAGVFKVPVERLEKSTYNENDVYFDRNGMSDMKALQSDVDAAADLGFLKEHIDLKKNTDLTIMEDAVKRVGAVK